MLDVRHALRRLGIAALALTVGALVWLPLVHLRFAPAAADLPHTAGVSPLAEAVVGRQLALWTDPALREGELARMRAANAEWDFMARTFLVLALGNLAERDPSRRDACLQAMDAILEETVRLEAEHGHPFFLMAYAHASPWILQPPRSLFVDGEIALMLGARCLVEPRDDYLARLKQRVETALGRMHQGPLLSAESYPDECWTFCNAVALAATRIHDALSGEDHGAFLARWVEVAKARLTDPGTGLLISSYDLEGRVQDGPEGSSIWLVAHCLQLVDPDFARDQYERARRELAVDVLGFGYAREWPASWTGPRDIDSGAIVPLVGASASSSGFAVLAAAGFEDRETLTQLLTSLELAAFPVETPDGVRYAASNQVGDAVLAYALTCGPLWRKVGAQ